MARHGPPQGAAMCSARTRILYNVRYEESDEGKASVEVVESVETELYVKVRRYIARARAKVYAAANSEMVVAYWNVGREPSQHAAVLPDISKTLHAV